MGFPEAVAFFFVALGRVACFVFGERPCAASLARFALAEAVVVAEEILAVEARDFLASFDVSKNANARRVTTRCNKLLTIK